MSGFSLLSFYRMVTCTIVFCPYPVPPLHIVFGPDLISVEVGGGVIVLCVHNISCTGLQIFIHRHYVFTLAIHVSVRP